MASERAQHGRKTNIPWYDALPSYRAPAARRYYKRVLNRNRRIDDRAVVTAELDGMCSCPACQAGRERECWASVNVDDNGCPFVGNGGWHSAAYYDDGACVWCGLVQVRTTLGTLERLPW